MGDPRNIAHAKKVTQEKQHKDKHTPKPASPKSANKPGTEKTKQTAAAESAVTKPEAERTAQPPDSTQLEKSLVVLSKLKELEFHSRSNIEKLAELSLTIEEELKQKAFAEGIGAVYAAQDAFQSKILKLIEAYEAECSRLSGSA
jgi:flagellar biosynthesis/type III secretory pathway protein FliH